MENGTPQLLCYQSAKPLEVFVDHFDVMMNSNSILFHDCLSSTWERRLAMTSELTIEQINTDIWQPVFEYCQNLLESLINQTMTLSFVDQNLSVNDYPDKLSTMVNNLDIAVSRCLKKTHQPEPLRKALKKIGQYWRLCEYQTGANVFLQLRNVLKLKGDFGVVELFSQQV